MASSVNVNLVIFLGGRLHSRSMQDAMISSGAIVEYFQHAFGVTLSAVHAACKPDATKWVFEVLSHAEKLNGLSRFDLANPDGLRIFFVISMPTSNVTQHAVNKVPASLVGNIMLVTDGRRNSITVKVEEGVLTCLGSQWSMEYVHPVLSDNYTTISLNIDGSTLLCWSDNDSKISVNKWKLSFELHREYSILRAKDDLNDRLIRESQLNKAASDENYSLNVAGIYIRGVAFKTHKEGESKMDCKLHFNNKTIFHKSIGRSSETMGCVRYNPPLYCFSPSSGDLKAYELKCEVTKSGILNSKSFNPQSLVPTGLLTCERGHDLDMTFDLQDGTTHYGTITFTFFRPVSTVLQPSHEFLLDPYLHFRVVRISVSGLRNVERLGGENDPFVKITREDTKQSWQLKAQEDAGEKAEWVDSDVQYPVGVDFLIRRSQLLSDLLTVATSMFNIEVVDHNNYSDHVLIGSCKQPLPVQLADLNFNDTTSISFVLQNAARNWNNAGAIKLELKRCDNNNPVRDSSQSPSAAVHASLGPALVMVACSFVPFHLNKKFRFLRCRKA
jgi:hypothetical protein